MLLAPALCGRRRDRPVAVRVRRAEEHFSSARRQILGGGFVEQLRDSTGRSSSLARASVSSFSTRNVGE